MRTTSLHITLILEVLMQLPLGKSAGPDGAASGSAAADEKLFYEKKLPLSWRGGLLVPFSRKILVGDQVSKIATKILHIESEKHTGQCLQQEQFLVGPICGEQTRPACWLQSLHFPSTEVGSFVHVAVMDFGGCACLTLPFARRSWVIPRHHRRIPLNLFLLDLGFASGCCHRPGYRTDCELWSPVGTPCCAATHCRTW